MDEEPAIEDGSLTPETTEEGTDPPDPSDDGYRPPRWAWFVLGGLAVVVLAIGVWAGDRDLLFEDDFSTSGALARWLEDESASGSMGYEGETYHVGVKQPGVLGSVVELPSRQSSIEVGVDASLVSGTGAVSVSCVADTGDVGDGIEIVNGAESYDVFVFASEGGVAIVASDRPEEALAVASTGTLHDGMNRVEFGCTGASGSDPATITVTINGTRVLEHEDPGGSDSFAAVGLSVLGDEGPAEAEFDNLEVSIR